MPYRDQDREYLGTLDLLLVEDEPTACEEMGYFLKPLVARVHRAGNGSEGLKSFEIHRPHLVVTDILMPVMDGLKMAAAIRELDPDVPIIVTTAFERTDYLLRSIDLGIDKYVMKPVNMEKLKEAVLECARRLLAVEQLKLQREREGERRRLEATGLLAGGMAHDYNNLLQGIMGCVDLAKMSAEPECKAMEYIDAAKKLLEKGRELGRNLLIFAKGGMVAFHKAPIGPLLKATVQDTIRRNLVIHGLKKKVPVVPGTGTVSPQFDIATDLPEIDHDGSLLPLVFAHLTVNALEAMPSGGALHVSARLVALPEQEAIPLPKGEYLQIIFRDQGHGILPENLDRIFLPYFTTKNWGAVKGMGLGLSLCESIIRKHGGSIQVESQPGAGATFTLYLPLTQPDLEPTRQI